MDMALGIRGGVAMGPPWPFASLRNSEGVLGARNSKWKLLSRRTRWPAAAVRGMAHEKMRGAGEAMVRATNKDLTSVVIRLHLSSAFHRILAANAKRNSYLCVTSWSSQSSDAQVANDEEVVDSEETETEEVARSRNWKERGWAPWDVLLTPEAQFALDSLEDGDEEPVVAWEKFAKLNQKPDSGQMERELEERARKAQAERDQPIDLEGSLWAQPLVFSLVPPRDWPPPGWEVDSKELAYIREAHIIEDKRLTMEDLEVSKLEPNDAKLGVPRWEMFLKQYHDWVAANKDILERDALEMDAEYYAGRRRRGEEYGEGMYELPFIYPGQHYWGIVTYVNLYEGAFVYFGGVHDGWVPIMDNDWYELRHIIRPGMRVQVEVIAKRDPYRFRFPIEMRFVDPNIDHLIFRRYEHPPILFRKEDKNLDDIAREANRPYHPKLRPEVNPEYDSNVAPVHPYVRRFWVVHAAEQMVLEDEEGINVDGEEWEDWATLEEDDPTGDWEYMPGILHQTEEGLDIPTIVVPVEEKYLNLEPARAEREAFNKLRTEAEARGEEFEQPDGRFERRVKELNDMHQQRWSEQKEALLRDRTCRLELGLPLEEPGRYADKSFWGKNPYDPRLKRWRHDYWGDPEKMKDELRKDREPRVKQPEEVVVYEDEDDLLDVIEGDATMLTEEDALVGDNILKELRSYGIRLEGCPELEKIRLVNGTSMKSMDPIRDPFDGEEGEWKSLDNSEIEIKEEGGEDE